MTTKVLSRILYVEDEPDIREVATLALESVGGFIVEACASGEEALSAFPRVRPDLILLDVMMPGMDGPTTLTRLRELADGRDVPAVFMTAKVQPREIVELKAAGALDVIPKPFDPMTLSNTVREIWAKNANQAKVHDVTDQKAPAENSLEREIARIANAFARALPDKLAEITALYQGICSGKGTADDRQSLHRAVHSLTGSAKTFGLPQVSDAARKLEHALKPLVVATESLGLVESVGPLVDDLVRSAKQSTSPEPVKVAPAAAPATAYAADAKLIYFLTEQGDRDRLGEQLESFGYEVLVLATPAELRNTCRERAPAAILAEATVGEAMIAGVQSMDGSHQSGGKTPPLIFVSDRDELEIRLHAVRAGGRAFFHRPVNIGSLVDRIEQLIVRAVSEPYRVTIVEDSEEQAAFYAAALRDAGMLVCVVGDPAQLLENLTEFRPELVLLDMYLPGCAGDDLARVIRQMDAYIGLPIVFLSVETDFNRQLVAMELGGDEFLTKPILPAQLVSVVESRVSRYRTLSALMVQDGLTGLANHSRLHQLLETEFARAQRLEISLCLVMIDVDHFKLVNDHYGHPTGDRVLQALARFLRQRLRRSDLVARYGGEEFAVLMTDIDEAGALRIIDRLRKEFAAQAHQSDAAATFNVTFSAGIAANSGYSTDRQLLVAADRALYQAKHNDRNRVVTGSALAE